MRLPHSAKPTRTEVRFAKSLSRCATRRIHQHRRLSPAFPLTTGHVAAFGGLSCRQREMSQARAIRSKHSPRAIKSARCSPAAMDRECCPPFGPTDLYPLLDGSSSVNGTEPLSPFFQNADLSRRLSRQSSFSSTDGVSRVQNSRSSPEGIGTNPQAFGRCSRRVRFGARELVQLFHQLVHAFRLGFAANLKLKPRNFRSHGGAIVLLSAFTWRLSFVVMNRSMLFITRSPARRLRT